MAQWEAKAWDNEEGVSLIFDGRVVAGVEGLATGLEITRKLNAVDEVLAALRIVLPFAVHQQECFIYKFLPDPIGDERSYLDRASEAVDAIRYAIAKAEGRTC